MACQKQIRAVQLVSVIVRNVRKSTVFFRASKRSYFPNRLYPRPHPYPYPCPYPYLFLHSMEYDKKNCFLPCGRLYARSCPWSVKAVIQMPTKSALQKMSRRRIFWIQITLFNYTCVSAPFRLKVFGWLFSKSHKNPRHFRKNRLKPPKSAKKHQIRSISSLATAPYSSEPLP